MTFAGYRLVRRFLAFSLLWWILTEGYPGAWSFGLPVIVLAFLVSMALPTAGDWTWRLPQLLRFAFFFLGQSLRGGIDVARRALHPRLPIAPQLLEYRLRLAEGPARIFFADALSLLPGTCSVMLRGDALQMHVLDGSQPVEQALRRVEGEVAGLFGMALPPARGDAE